MYENSKGMRSEYAPAERAAIEKIKEDFEFIRSVEHIEKLLNSLPYLAAILNQHRQVVFANKILLEMLGLETVEGILGERPGEILHCIHAENETGGCGTSRSCSVCGALASVLESQKSNQTVIKESRITSKGEEGITAYDFRVSSAPFHWGGEAFYMVTFIDISNERRRRMLEKIFFHDVMNKTGSLFGFIDLMKHEKDIHKIHELINYMDIINKDLTDEIRTQRDLSAAESGDLKIKPQQNNSLDIINSSANQIKLHKVAKDKKIQIDSSSDSFDITTDGEMLRRILTNMLKNALEATLTDGKITIGCNSNKEHVFWVHNPTFIPEKNQLQIFQRSFSTKGGNRGLGTYSMKLLGENYLKGQVGFVSNENTGTKFYIKFKK